MRILSATLMAAVVAASLSAQTPNIVYSNGSSPTAGGGNAFPWGSVGLRYQQIIDGTQFKARTCLIQDILVTGDANRPDPLIEHTDIQISMGRTAVTNAGTTTNWDTNLPPKNKTVVYRGPLDIFHQYGSWRGIGLPAPYRFLGLPAEPNLCIEIITWKIKGRTAPSNFYFPRSASAALGGSIRRAFRYNWINNQSQAPLTGTGASRIGILCDNGNFVVTGSGCGAMTLSGGPPAWPQGGKPYTFNLAGAANTTPCLLFLGARQLPPIDLTGIGMTKCMWYVQPFVIIVTVSNATGGAKATFPLPNLIGARGYVQWLNRNPSANPFGWTTSGMGTIIVGT